MEYSLVEFSRLKDDQIKQLTLLHVSVMHTLLSDLGLPFVWRYYQIAQADSKTIGFCAVAASGEILGWAMGSPHPDRITAQLRSPFAWFILQMLRVTLTRPILLWQLISSVRSSTDPSEMKGDAVELTYIGVAANQRGRGIGETLLNTFCEASRSHGYRRVLLSVERKNSPAISLYEKAGFKIFKTFREGGYQRHRMELSLA